MKDIKIKFVCRLCVSSSVSAVNLKYLQLWKALDIEERAVCELATIFMQLTQTKDKICGNAVQ